MGRGNALVVGVTGISGHNAAERLTRSGWTVYGLSRSGTCAAEGVTPIQADVTDAEATALALAPLDVTHVFYCTWSRQSDEAANCAVNGAMLRNVLRAAAGGRLQHVALVTGLKHYLGPFEAYAKTPMETPFREEQPRLPYQNFYYDQEDILFEESERHGFTWSVHRPHTMIGWALGNVMNMGVTLAVYGALCRETGQPFVFPGSPQQYEGVTDITDARLLARQLDWAATTPEAADQAMNTVNGDLFRWRRMWTVVADGLGLEPAPYPGHPDPLEPRFHDAQDVWDRIVKRHNLQPYPLGTLASWWHTDGDLGRTTETFADMSKSRRLGFLEYQDSSRSFLDLFDTLRTQRIIPPLNA
ncbi:SDR family oxidoreductase [Streptosporangiaceae bacterium NEAU-GS5]|nr:SDR family oxidoreductase [Streptosporangiaceae bacterium NEAU-GS5]